jgi:hypothetical protein
MRCNRTVLDIFSDISLCPQHSSEVAPITAVKRKSVQQPRSVTKKVKMGVAKKAAGKVRGHMQQCRHVLVLYV